MTYRERRERKLQKLQEWAAARKAKEAAAIESAHRISDGIPLGQPILVGHHSERHARRDCARITGAYEKAHEHHTIAARHADKAATIRQQLEQSIYSDDADAVERLQEKIAAMEAERARIVAYNKSCRAGQRDCSLLDEKQKKSLILLVKHCPEQLGKNGAMPAYVCANLSGNIARARKRLPELQARAAGALHYPPDVRNRTGQAAERGEIG